MPLLPGKYKYKYRGAGFIQIQFDTPAKPSYCRCAPPAGPSFVGQSSPGTTPPTSASRMATARSPSRPGKTANTADTSESSLRNSNLESAKPRGFTLLVYLARTKSSFLVTVGGIHIGRQVCN